MFKNRIGFSYQDTRRLALTESISSPLQCADSNVRIMHGERTRRDKGTRESFQIDVRYWKTIETSVGCRRLFGIIKLGYWRGSLVVCSLSELVMVCILLWPPA